MSCTRCTECQDEEHHWAGYYVFAEEDGTHEAAQQGLLAWEVCKHCPAWRDADLPECEGCGIALEAIDIFEVDGETFCGHLCADRYFAQEGSFDDDGDEAEANAL